MNLDTKDLTRSDRDEAVRSIANFLTQQKSQPGVYDDFASLSMVELDKAIEDKNTEARKASSDARYSALNHLSFLAARRRDLKYALASRSQLEAHAMNQAMLRNYFAARSNILFPS
jgi:hypothetical protein